MSVLVTEDTERALLMGVASEMWTPPISYKYLRQDVTVTTLQSICCLLGQDGQLECIVDYVLTEVMSTDNWRAELLLVTHWILQGVSGATPTATPTSTLMEGLLSMTEEGTALCDNGTVFVLNIISDIARIHEQNFALHIQSAVVITLESVSHCNTRVATSALLATRDIAKYTGHE